MGSVAAVIPHEAAYVAAGYLITAVGLGGYVATVVLRARRARRRVEAVVARRNGTR